MSFKPTIGDEGDISAVEKEYEDALADTKLNSHTRLANADHERALADIPNSFSFVATLAGDANALAGDLATRERGFLDSYAPFLATMGDQFSLAKPSGTLA